MKSPPFFLSLALALALAACATRSDSSHYVLLGAHRGYYLIEPGSPLQDKLGYGRAPIADTSDPLHRGYGKDVIAFRFNRAGLLAAPPAYLAQSRPNRSDLSRLGCLIQGVTTRDQVEKMFPPGNSRFIQPDGGLLVYHDVPVYNALEEMTQPGGAR